MRHLLLEVPRFLCIAMRTRRLGAPKENEQAECESIYARDQRASNHMTARQKMRLD